MKKSILYLVFAFISLCTYGQKITTSEVDKFTGKKIVETSFEKIVTNKNILVGVNKESLNKDVWIAFKGVDDNIFLIIKWVTNIVTSLNSDSNIIFLDEDDNPYTFFNTEYTITGKGEGTPSNKFVGSAMYGLDIYATGDYSVLKDKNIKAMRIYTTDGYVNFNIPKKRKSTLADTYKVFKSEYGNTQ